MMKNSVDVYDKIMNKQAHIYICGDVKMAEDVTETIQNILMTQGNFSKDKAADVIKKLKVSKNISILHYMVLFNYFHLYF